MPQITIFDLVEGPRGYMWFATFDGLLRFDGLNFVSSRDASIPSFGDWKTRVLSRYGGTFWVGTRDGLFCVKGAVVERLEGLPHESILHVFSEDGRLWVGTADGLVALEPPKGTDSSSKWTAKVVELPVGVSAVVQAIVRDTTGRLWIGTDAGLVSLDADGKASSTPLLTDTSIHSLLVSPQGKLWIGTSTGLYGLGPDGARLEVEVPLVHTMAYDREGALWIGTERGLWSLQDGLWTARGEAEGFPVERIHRLWLDDEGHFWVGTHFEGLYRIRLRRISRFGEPEGLENPLSWAVYQRSDGDLLVGNLRGLNRIDANGIVSDLGSRYGLPEASVISLLEDSRGTLWIGSVRGLHKFEEGVLERLSDIDGSNHPRVNSLVEDARGGVWIGTHGAGLRCRDCLADGQQAIWRVSDGLPHDTISALEPTPDGGLWIGTVQGVARLDAEGRMTRFSEEDGLAGEAVRALHLDVQGNLWIGMQGGRISLWQGERLRSIGDPTLQTDAIYRILEDDQGFLWTCGNRGIRRIDKRALEAWHPGDPPLPWANYDEYDGMASRECSGTFQPAGWKTNDGRLWFPTLEGLAVLEPELFPRGTGTTRTLIEQVVVDRQILEPTEAMVIPPGHRSLEVHFAALERTAPHRVRLRYRLVGFDERWVDVGSRRVAFFTNLPPGSFRFELLAMDGDGRLSNHTTTLHLEIMPAFHQTWWFRICALFLVVAIPLLIYRIRVRRVIWRNQELLETKRLLESRNKDLEEFSTTFSHDLSNPVVTISTFLGRLERHLETGDASALRSDLSRIQRASSTLRRLLDELEQVTQLSRRVARPERFSLERLAQRVVTASEAGGKIEVVGTLPEIVADPEMIHQVLGQLVDNAIKFSIPGEGARIKIGTLPNSPDPTLFVQDFGIGISTKYQEQIFRLFDQLDPAVEGVGMGLPMVQRLVQIHGGRIWFESEGSGKGTTFYFTLPQAKSRKTQ